MDHDWRKYPTIVGVVMACSKCGDVQRAKNRLCPGKDEADFVQTHILNRPPETKRKIDLIDPKKMTGDYSI
jgi:hypothetical protein